MKEQSTPSTDSGFLKTDGGKTSSNAIEIPAIALPKGGGALKGIDEKFSVNAVDGTASFSIPLPFAAARGLSPSLSLSYSSASGNSPFGLGWSLSLGSIKRATNKAIPKYQDAVDSDTFIFSEAEDLVPEFKKETDGSFSLDAEGAYVLNEKDSTDGLYTIRFYRPRIEGLFARIERWTEKATGIIKWRIMTRDNVTTLFGWSNQSVLADPKDPRKIAQWFPEFVFDDKGNCSHYRYKKEDGEGLDEAKLHNKNRVISGVIAYTNLYLEKVCYGNKTPYTTFGVAYPAETDYMFQTVFDYGEYNLLPPYTKIKEWDFRSDAFSSYKVGFEVRTTRLCKRVLLFHHFAELAGGSALVKSADFDYDTSVLEDFTFLRSVTAQGYIKQTDGTYSSKKLPAMEFTYQSHEWNKAVHSIASEDLVHAPAGLDEPAYLFTDLYNEGLAGLLTEQANGWYYKHNLGDGHFERAKFVTPKPSFAGLGNLLQVADLDADGGKQVVQYSADPKGFFELNDDNEWSRFQYFQNVPTINFNSDNIRMIDLNGDGKPELLVTEDSVFTWYESEGRKGFSKRHTALASFDEETGPHLLFTDLKQTIFLADMSGDGTTDIVRIRNGEVCYWPNLGYGKFGAKVGMDHAPLFDYEEAFNPSYLKLADIDGSGTTDLIYLGKNKFTCWMNLSGNAFSTVPFELEAFPEIHNRANITVTDLLGNGMGCIVWSSRLSKDATAPLRYVDLMNSKKPHVMIAYKNNLGKEVSLSYTPSTRFFLEDKLAGKPWITKLHFPVHCVSKMEIRDAITGHRFTSSYTYHHGYYDHPEKEFRGFGSVEQTDTEQVEHWIKGGGSNVVDAALYQAPVVTKTWFHTGAFLNREKILHQFEQDYWYEELNRQGFAVTHPEVPLPEAPVVASSGIPASVMDHLSAQEWREAARACKGKPLRSEVFAYDAPSIGATPDELKKQLTPFTVTDSNCTVELLQPKGQNKYAVFVVKARESLAYNYERTPDDARITHSLNVQLDEWGNVLESASVVYPRLVSDASLPLETQQAQNKTIITYTKNRFTNDVFQDNSYRLRLPSETQTFELQGVAKPFTFYTVDDFVDVLSTATEVPYHDLNTVPVLGTVQKRLLEHVRTTYLRNDLTGPLPLHQLESLALSSENYQLAYTPELVTDIYGTKVTAALLLSEGKFTSSEGDANWWVRSGSTQYMQGIETAADAQSRFYVPVSYTDPFGASTKVTYDSSYKLYIEKTEDALGNTSHVDLFNFRTLTPQRMRDINNNLSESISDELGLVKAAAVFGKGTEADDLTGFTEHTPAAEQAAVQAFFAATLSTELTSEGKALLQQATTRYLYDFDVYKNTGKPAVVATVQREEHTQKNSDSPVQLSFDYSDGLGNIVMTKKQAEPGFAKRVIVFPDNSYALTEEDTSALIPQQLRWIGNGRSVLNNKGKAIKQYEPYFSITHRYEDQKELVESGVTAVLYYDALGRLMKTENPNGTLSRTVFTSWKQLLYDVNDTLLESSWYILRTNRLMDAQLLAEGKDPGREKLSADKAVKHADTPVQVHFDVLGRGVLSIDHNKNSLTDADEFTRTKIILDVEGNLRSVTDGRELPENGNKGNQVMQYKYDMLGNKVYQNSMDSGQQWLLSDVLGSPLRTWDERNHEFQYAYDIMHRALHSKVLGGDGPAPLDHIFDRIVYGESLLLPGRTNEAALQAKNNLGVAIQHFDTGGVLLTPEYDFKGKALFSTRQLFKYYKIVANWIDANLVSDLESETFTFATEMDALGRISKQTAPDGSIIHPSYNQTGLFNGESVTHIAPSLTATYIKDIDYNEKGQRTKIIYGNDVVAKFYYDKETFRLKRLESKRQNNDPLQDWHYTSDPSGNITFLEDKNIPVTFFGNEKTTGLSEYTYDALYRLTVASGRENNAALNFGSEDNWNDAAFMHQLSPGDPMAVRSYTQHYQYDEVGNILQLRHLAAGNNWTRTYNYEKTNNRLKTTQVGSQTYTYTHHPQMGFITAMNHLEDLGWSFKEELVKSIRQKVAPGNGTAETTYYQYDGQGQRIRKITENFAAAGQTPTKKDERIYYSGYETYRTYQSDSINFERQSLSLIDQGNRFVMVETVKQNTAAAPDLSDAIGARLTRFQLNNHLGSAALELDTTAQVISYEEYHPFGTTAYQAKSAAIKAAAKRYRFTGVERDEETGLEYHSARYYLPWLGRWLSADPKGIGDGVNRYAYCKNNPLVSNDTSGTQADDPQLNFYQCSVFQSDVTATYSSRGISPDLRATYTGLYRVWTGDYSSTVDVGHMGTPFVFLRAGDVSPVGPQLSSENRSDGGGAVRAQAALVRASGGFAREDGIDTSPTGIASRGTRYPANPRPASIADPRLAVIGRASGPPVTAPLVTLPASSSTAAPTFTPATSSGPAQLSFPFVEEESPQLSFNFSSSSTSGPSCPAPSATSSTPAPQQLSFDFENPPAQPTSTPVSTSSSSSSSGGGSSRPLVNPASSSSAALGSIGRTVVPGVAEAEVVLTSSAVAAAPYSATVSTGLFTAAEAVPVVAGVGVVGAGGGHVVRYIASEAGASQDTADGLGFAGAVGVGAALGSVVPGVGTAVGAIGGGIVAGGLYLWSIW